MTSGDDFSREDIESLLEALAHRLTSNGCAASIYIVGGVAIALRGISDERRTGDIDALMVPEDRVLEAARAIAQERGIRPNWLNSAARPYVPPAPPGMVDDATSPGLAVRIAPVEHLLAMKILAARGRRDTQDIIELARRAHVSTADELTALVCDIYGEDAIEHVHGGRVDLELHCAAVARLLADD